MDVKNFTPEALGIEVPDMSLKALIGHFGPGLILMMTGIGTSHLVSAPTAGGRFEYALLWCIPVAYIFKYYGFEMAFRFTNATGRSIMDAYTTAAGKWPIWYVMVITLVQMAIGQAGRVVAASAVAYILFSVYAGLGVPLWGWAIVLCLIAVTIILGGKYEAVEVTTKIMAGLLVVSSLVVYFIKPAPASAYAHFFIFDTPSGSWLIIAAFLGLLPTGVDVSLQASEWGKAKKKGLGRIREKMEEAGMAPKFDPFSSGKADLSCDIRQLPEETQEYCVRWFKIGIWDFRVGHIISFFVACVFLLLAALWLYPSPVKGKAVMGELAKMFTESVGAWAMVIFIGGAFAATFSTMFNYFDGWPRVIGACCRNLFKGTANLMGTDRAELSDEAKKTWYSEYNIYRITMMYSLVFSVAVIAGMPKPVFLVLVASALAYFIAPVVFYLNMYYCFTCIPKDEKRFYPNAFDTIFGWFSLAVFTGLTVIMILARIFKIPLMGA